MDFLLYRRWKLIKNSLSYRNLIEILDLGRISDSSVTSELVYAVSNMLVFFNDRIIENSQSSKAPTNPTAQKLKVMLTTLEYCEVFIEIGSKRLWGKKGRWYFIVAIQVIK